MQIFSLLNYVGHKSKLVDKLIPLFPSTIDGIFWDIFCGSCVVGLSTGFKDVNFVDTNEYLINLYSLITSDKFEEILENVISKYNLTNSSRVPRSEYLKSPEIGTCTWHGKTIKNLHLDKLNSSGYSKLLFDFNNSVFDNDILQKSIAYMILTIYGRNSNVSLKKDGKLQGGVGPLDYSIKTSKKLKEHIEVISGKTCNWICADYSKINYSSNDFIYLDPPYLASSYKYTGWSEEDEKRLLDWIDTLNCKWALSNTLVSGDEKNSLLDTWSKKYKVVELDKSYRKWATKGKSSAQKEIKETREIIVMNY